MLNLQNFERECNNMQHVMLDIETLSTGSHAVVPQIGAVQFNPATGELGKRINLKISIQSMLDIGAKISESTLRFWLDQSREAQQSVFDKKDGEIVVDIHTALQQFKIFLQECSRYPDNIDVRIWGNGPSFDASKITALYELTGSERPWKYFNERCVRTISGIDSDVRKSTVFTGIKHDAISDCEHQIKYVSSTMKELHNMIATFMTASQFVPEAYVNNAVAKIITINNDDILNQ